MPWPSGDTTAGLPRYPISRQLQVEDSGPRAGRVVSYRWRLGSPLGTHGGGVRLLAVVAVGLAVGIPAFIVLPAGHAPNWSGRGERGAALGDGSDGAAATHPAIGTVHGIARGPSTLGRAGTPGPAGVGVASSRNNWTRLNASTSPPARYNAMMVYDAKDGDLVLFGGSGPQGHGAGAWHFFNDTWTFKRGVWTNVSPSPSPSARWAAAMTYDAADGYVLMFGGYDGSANLGQTWKYSGGVWTQLSPAKSPPARGEPMMAYDARDGYVVLFGGFTGQNYVNDTWTFHAGNWTKVATSSAPVPRADVNEGGLAYDTTDRYVVLFGGDAGYGGGSYYNDTWTFASGNWSRLNLSVAPPARAYEAMTFDSESRNILLFGGYENPRPLRDTWTFAHGTWVNVSQTPAPKAWLDPNLADDPADGYPVYFGGADYGYPSATCKCIEQSTWEYLSVFAPAVSLSPSEVDLGQSTTITVSGTLGWTNLTIGYPTLPPGCASSNASTLVCRPNASGSFPITVNVSAPGGPRFFVNTSLTVNPELRVVAFSAEPSAVTLGAAANFTAQVANGTAPYTYAYSGLPTACSSQDAGSIKCTSRTAGTYRIAVNVTDGALVTDEAVATFVVNPDPTLVVFTASPPVVDLGQPIRLAANATGGTPPVSFSYGDLPPGCSTVNAPILTCVPAASGRWSPELTINDSDGYRAVRTTSLVVNPDPVVTSFNATPEALDLGQSTTISIGVMGGTGAYGIEFSGLPSGCAAVNVTDFSCSPATAGNFSLEVTVTDEVGGSAHRTLPLRVAPSPAVASFTASRPVIDQGQTEELRLIVSGGVGPLAFSYAGLPTGCVPQNLSVLSCTPAAVGSSRVTVTVRDPTGAEARAAVAFTVDARLEIPSFVATPSNIDVGQWTNFSARITGGSGGPAYDYTGLPPGCVPRNESVLPCLPSSPGSFTVEVTVGDGAGAVQRANATLLVEAPPPITRAAGGTGVPVAVGLAAGVVVLAAVAAAVLVLRGRPRSGPGKTAPDSGEEMHSGEEAVARDVSSSENAASDPPNPAGSANADSAQGG